jgi:hypothetical protein
MKKTITEALAELKTIGKRIEKKREFIASYLGRQEKFRDPHEKDGGSAAMITRERQAVRDLEERSIQIRNAIQLANRENTIAVEGRERSIQDWLCWRRDVAPGQQQFLKAVQRQVLNLRQQAQAKGYAVNPTDDAKPDDVIINVNEAEMAGEIEQMETVLGTLDGLLSLKNATITIEVAD